MSRDAAVAECRHDAKWIESFTGWAARARDEQVRAILTLHYITAIDCDHEAKTDTVRCNCSIWTGTPQPSVGAAVQEWIDHVLEARSLAPAASEPETTAELCDRHRILGFTGPVPGCPSCTPLTTIETP